MVNFNQNVDKKLFEKLILESVNAIKKESNDEALRLIKMAASINIERPEIYNLLGIVYEQKGDNFTACKFYRVAYYIDQTYKAANDNLGRVSDFFYRGFINVNYGIDRCVGGSK